MNDEALIRMTDVTKAYRRGRERVEVLRDLTLEVPRGDFVALMGPSGSGKTTLLNLIGGLDRPDSGAVEVEGQRIDR
ncbi:MAG TPA: ATP-binding cassette domain-containing protein, partial [Thermoanaerobaculia bacterium]|nr:ATP-binding cassette domain-containing protein [Thermoanaerobaculia bacterium]